MPIEIGEIIRKEIKSHSLNYVEFGKLINRHEKTVQSILKRKTIDTELLLNISKALDHDFFKYFYDEPPLKIFKENEMKTIYHEISGLKKEITQKEEYIASNSKYIQSQEEVIRLLKEKERYLDSQ
jgi:plasmid maintenance system antidote protein VapI